MGILITIISVIFFILCVLLVILILLQSDKSAGMGILGGSSQSTFGSSTADVITKATGVMIGLFMLGSLGLAALESNRMESLKEDLLKSEEKSTKDSQKEKGENAEKGKNAEKDNAKQPADKDKVESNKPVK